MRTLNDLILRHGGRHIITKGFLAVTLLILPAFAQEIQITGEVTVSGSTTTTTAPQVITPQPLSVTPAPLPSGTTGTAYGLNGQGVTISASNGTAPYTCAISGGSLPTGLSLASCIISGTPTVAGTSNFTIQVTDAKAATGTLAASIVIANSLAITQTTVPSGTVGTLYSLTFVATGGSGGGYTFSTSAGTVPPGLSLASPTLSGTPTQAGSFPLTVTVTDSGANTASWSFTITINPAVVTSNADNRYCTASGTWIGATTDGPAALPTSCFYTPVSATPSPGTVRTTTAANFNTTYAASSCGDTIKVTGGTSFTGTWNITKQCDSAHWITIEGSGVTSDVNFPAEGTRTSPCFSNVSSLPNRPTYSCGSPAADTAQVAAASSTNAVKITGASYHRFIGIEFTRVTTAKALIFSVIDLTSAATQTNNIIFDRVWCHGVNADGTFPQSSATDTSTTRCLYLGQSNHVAVIDSYLSDFYDNGATASNGNTDAQAIGGGVGGISNSGWGVYKFVNNHIEGASEGIILGGGGGPPVTPTGCTKGINGNCNPDVPTNIEVRRNLFFAPNSWNGNTTSINATGWPNRKNGIEFKTGANILLEANVMQNCWYSSQPYCYVFDFAPKNQMSSATDPGGCPSCFVKNYVARYNYGYNYPGVLIANYTTSFVGGCTGCGQTWANFGSIHDNLVGDKLNRGSLGLTGFDGLELLTGAGPIFNLSIRHNTIVNAYRSLLLLGASTNGAGASGFDHFTFQDNIGTYTSASGGAPFLAANGSAGTCDTSGITLQTFLTNCINGTTATWTLDHNFVFGTASLTGWPSGNTAEATSTAMGFTSYGTGDSNMTPGNYALTAGSPGHNAASDGSDVGANITQLNSEISGVASY